MSTCPNPDLFSALYDGEVPSPWKEKLESHLGHCSACAKRLARYAAVGKALKAGTGELPATQEWLDRSFERLTERAVSGKESAFRAVQSAWTRKSIRLSLPALAAMLVAAVILPAVLVMVSSRNGNSADQEGYASIQPAQGLTVSRDASIYSMDPLPQSVAGQMLVSNQQLFTMVDYARQFSSDDSLFDDAQIIIIKLPDLTHFGGSEDPIITNKDTLQSVASFNK